MKKKELGWKENHGTQIARIKTFNGMQQQIRDKN
jgi:hypothetical protein